MIPLKLETLLDGRVVEQDRVEYKRGWNPTDTIHSICAYANDFTNINGGYIVIGVESDNGRPLLPPVGVGENNLDRIQNELFQYCNLIEPRYLPQLEIVEYKGAKLIYLWCSAGDAGPYSAPRDVLSKNNDERRKEYWIKPFAVKTAAKQDEKFELFEKFNSVPFDDRVNRKAKISDIMLGHIRDFLIESNSSLADDVYSRSVEDTLVSLEVANVSDAGVNVRNIALLMFSDYPEKFMPCAQIELVWFHSPEEEGSDDFTEKTFSGPLFRQVKEALGYIKNQVIVEKVVKVPGRAESDRFFNFPYEALEEALANACQHKSYQIAEPVEIRIYLDRIMIINYPGPALWIDMGEFREGKAISRRYRNRRIGEFFKEIDLAEKKSTGITKILRTLEKNGSPPPTFKTDSERHSLETIIWIREGFTAKKVFHRRPNFIISEPDEYNYELAIAGDKQAMTGDKQDMAGDKQAIKTGDKLAITGDKQAITGDKQDMVGDKQDMAGDKQAIKTGDKQAMTGDKQAVTGDRKQVIIDYLQTNEEARNVEFAELLGLSLSRTRYVLKPLIEDDIIEKCGDKKSTYYRLKVIS